MTRRGDTKLKPNLNEMKPRSRPETNKFSLGGIKLRNGTFVRTHTQGQKKKDTHVRLLRFNKTTRPFKTEV